MIDWFRRKLVVRQVTDVLMEYPAERLECPARPVDHIPVLADQPARPEFLGAVARRVDSRPLMLRIRLVA